MLSKLGRPVINDEMLQAVREESYILHAIKWKKDNWIGHVLRRNCLLKHVFEGKIKGTGRRRRRRKPILDDLEEKRGYCKLKEEALDRPVWRISFGSDYGPVVRQKKKKTLIVGQDGSVGMATRYGLGGLGIESR